MTTLMAMVRRVAAAMVIGGLFWASGPAWAACAVTKSLSASVGPVSPNAIRKGASAANQTRAGLTCDATLLVVLGGTGSRRR